MYIANEPLRKAQLAAYTHVDAVSYFDPLFRARHFTPGGETWQLQETKHL